MRRLGCLFVLLIAAGLVFAGIYVSANWTSAGPLKEPATIAGAGGRLGA